MKKILAVERSGLYYGSAINLRDWINYYTTNKLASIDVLVGEDGELCEKLKEAGANIQNIYLPEPLNTYGKALIKISSLFYGLFSYLKYNVKVISKLRMKSYDVVVFNNYRSSVFYFVFLIYLRFFTSTKVIVRLQISQTPLRLIFRVICLLCHSIIVHGTPEYCLREFGKRVFELKKTVCLPNPVDIKKFKFDPSSRRLHRQKLGIKNDKIVLMSVCYIEPRKGLLELVDCFVKENKDMLLVHIGDHGSHDEYHGKVLKAANDNVIFLGKRDDVSELYSIADVFILNSKYEGMPYVIVEAMASSLPVISTLAGSNEEVVTNDVGELISYGDNERLSALIRNIPRNIENLKALGDNARRRVVEKYSDENYYNILTEII